MKIITTELINAMLQIIASARTEVSYQTINQLIKEVSELKDYDTKGE